MRRLLSRDSRVERLIQDGTWVGVGQALSVIAQLIGLRVITALASPGVYGEAALLIGAIGLVRDVFCAPVLSATLRFFPEAAAEGRSGALRKVMTSFLVRRTLIAALFLFCGGAAWLAFSKAEMSLVVFGVLVILLGLEVRRLFEMDVLNAQRRQAAFAMWGTSDTWARVLCAIGMITIFEPSALSIVLGYAIGAGIVNVLVTPRVVSTPRDDASGDVVWATSVRARISSYAAPLAPLAILAWITTLGDRYALAEMVNADEVGVYAAAAGLASQPFLLVSSTIAITFRPILFSSVAAKDMRRKRLTLSSWLALLLAAFIPGVILLDTLSEAIVQLLLGEEFWSAAPLLVWIGIATAIRAVEHVFSNLIYAVGRTDRLIVVQGAASATALGLFVVLIPEYGALGAALAIVGSRLVALGVTLWISRSHL